MGAVYSRGGYQKFRLLSRYWTRLWMLCAGMSTFGRVATRLATWFAPPYKARVPLSYMNRYGYVSPNADICHSSLELGLNVYIGDRVLIFQRKAGGSVKLGDRVCIYRDTIIETGPGGSLTVGAESSIHPRCQIMSYLAPIQIGSGVMIAPNCALYSYDHGVLVDMPIRKQPLQTKGGIFIGDEAWLGFGAIILNGVSIGEGAVVGAGSVVKDNVPDWAIVAGAPARVIKHRPKSI